jgi:formate dehydrogenase
MTADTPEYRACLADYNDFEAYSDAGGYQLVKALSSGKADKQVLLAELEASALRGLGGAGFPTGQKWRIVSSYDAPRNLAVNGDEGEPGTFKDRHYLSTDPHRMIEGVLIASHIVGIDKAYIYIRDEYPEIIEMLHTELAKVTKAGLDSHVDIELRRGAGAYICGEESAMIESIEGKRGLPRHRPPYVAETGLFGQPTLVNNIETLFWVRDILEHGAEWYNRQGKEGHPGFRTYSVSGRVKQPRLVTAPAGSTADELIAACGGMADDHHFKAYLPGGASGGILPASKADIPLDFGGSLAEEGCFVGSHAVVILSDQDNIWQAAQNLMQFFAHESCGQCTPCRSGTDKAAKLMAAACPDINLLEELAATMADASICGLGQAAPNPLLSAIKHFPQDIIKGNVEQNESLAAKTKPPVEEA